MKGKQADSTSPVDAARAEGSSPGASAAGATHERGAGARTLQRPAAPPGPPAGSPASSGPSPHSTPPLHSVGFTLSSLGYAVARRFREVLAPLELEPREFALLRAVGSAEGQTQQAIGERLQIPPSRMVAFIDALETRGLLERRLNPQDRRTRALHLTSAGRALLERAFTVAVAYEQDLCADLSQAQREQLLELLQRVGIRLDLPAGVHDAHRHPALADE